MIETTAACLRRPLLAALYTDAMVLADDTRACAEHQPLIHDDRYDDRLDPVEGVLLSCEQLRMTTRLMTVLSWLLAWRAVDAGEWTMPGSPRLDPLPPPDPAAVVRLPDQLRLLSEDGVAPYRRAAFLDTAFLGTAIPGGATAPASPVLAIQHRLAAAL